jgi:hypothetical protein
LLEDRTMWSRRRTCKAFELARCSGETGTVGAASILAKLPL